MSTTADKYIEDSKLLHDRINPCAGCGVKFGAGSTHAQVRECLDAFLACDISNPENVPSMEKMPWYCPGCLSRMEEMQRKREKENHVRRLRSRLVHEGLISKETFSKTFHNSDTEIEEWNPSVWVELRSYPLKKNFWICGVRGTGKTYAASCVLNKYIEDGLTAAQLSAMSLRDIGRDFNTDRRIDPFIQADILHIDDLDKPDMCSEAYDALWHLIDKRYERNGRLIITANRGARDLSEAWLRSYKNPGLIETLFDRMKPMGQLVIQGDGESLRGRSTTTQMQLN